MLDSTVVCRRALGCEWGGLTGTRRRKRRLRPSARRSTRVALPQRGATGPADQITPSRAEQPRPMGTRRSGVAELTNRAHTRAEQPTSARAQWSEVRVSVRVRGQEWR